MSGLGGLMLRIERLRRQLNQYAKDRSLTDPDVVRLSKRLDRLLNEYQSYGPRVNL